MESISEIALWFFIMYPFSIVSFAYVGIYSISIRKIKCNLSPDDVVNFLRTKKFPANIYLQSSVWEVARPVVTTTLWTLFLFRISSVVLGLIISYIAPLYMTIRDINLGVELHPLQIPMFVILMLTQTAMLWFGWHFGYDLCKSKL